MAINSRKISSFPALSDLTGNEYLMVAYNHKNYKIPTSLLISNIIKTINQVRNDGDGANNPITIITSDKHKYEFDVYNGKKGSKGDKGETGDKGPIGDSGVAIYNTDVSTLIVNSVDGEGHTDKELAGLILSAQQGVKLNTQLEALKEVYLDSQTEYDNLSASNKVDSSVKYLIFAEDE